ncbi:hypothetical protein RO575_05870 [Methylomonas sp. MO1]|uniref:hypothetical protein n=1 Tax=Methylomonas sp. MO1 TaxID=3073619 RepID=UPI0028A46717|nr:hypothetical protein [Methylomonas sp. MO1]MDT4289074.1 hypothetical protein [Methylomonas sp. MO1]
MAGHAQSAMLMGFDWNALVGQERQHFSVKLKWVPSDFSAKNLLAVYAFGAPIRPRHLVPTQPGVETSALA